VRCSGSLPWTLYVRTEVSAVRSVPILARSLPRHTRLTETDLRFVERPLDSVPNGILFDANQIVGMELNRAMNEGDTLRTSHLRQPKVVKRGDVVVVMSGAAGLTVRSQGKAMGDATPGERVKVVNSVTGVKVEGIAGTDGTVTVP
jgi:flagella basal body P-ring formation protein FlgA